MKENAAVTEIGIAMLGHGLWAGFTLGHCAPSGQLPGRCQPPPPWCLSEGGIPIGSRWRGGGTVGSAVARTGVIRWKTRGLSYL